MAIDVDSCYILDQLMCGRIRADAELPRLAPAELKSLKLVIPDARVMQDLDPEVETAFTKAVDALRQSGAEIVEAPMPALDHADNFFIERPVVVYEVWQHHREMLEAHLDEYDPFVGHRMSAGANVSDEEQQDRYRERQQIIDEWRRQFGKLEADAMLYPTVACLPPAISETDDDENARLVNLRCLRNTATINYIDGCSISLPCHEPGQAPVGFMLSAQNGADEDLYRMARAIEPLIRP